MPKLDILFIPGPNPTYIPSATIRSFIIEQSKQVQALLVVCTASHTLAQTGLLTGIAATGPRIMLPMLKKSYPNVLWEEKRVVQHGNIWTSGAGMNGFDMVQTYMKQTFDKDLVEIALSLSDICIRRIDFDT